MKALITGSEGFVGRYLRTELEENGYEVFGADAVPSARLDTEQVDLRDAEATRALIGRLRPDLIFHLAAMADVGKSWKQPRLCMELNVIVAVNLLEAIRAADPGIRTVIVGSSDEYGPLGEKGKNVSEETELRPLSPYAVSKRAQEEMARLYCRAYGMQVCMTRSFNHGGAGQKTGFMIPDFASGIVRVERGEQDAVLVGNLSSRRDFTHVRDVVRAYRLIAEKGRPGEVYNVGSGVTWSAQEILDRLRAMATREIPVRVDPSRMRPSDTPVIRCDHTRVTQDTGWQPELSLDEILRDTLEYYRSRE